MYTDCQIYLPLVASITCGPGQTEVHVFSFAVRQQELGLKAFQGLWNFCQGQGLAQGQKDGQDLHIFFSGFDLFVDLLNSGYFSRVKEKMESKLDMCFTSIRPRMFSVEKTLGNQWRRNHEDMIDVISWFGDENVLQNVRGLPSNFISIKANVCREFSQSHRLWQQQQKRRRKCRCNRL